MTKLVREMTTEEYEAYKTEKARIQYLAENDPDKLTVNDLENLEDGDEYWTELALAIACSRLRAIGETITILNTVRETGA